MTDSADDYNHVLRPVSGMTTQYILKSYDIFGYEYDAKVTLPMITVLGPGPHRVKRSDHA